MTFRHTGLTSVKRAGRADRGGKYGNIRTQLDGRVFDSRKEASRAGHLKILEKAGLISGLVFQPKFDLSVNGHHICYYIGDFGYSEGGKLICEDVKSEITRKKDVFVLKMKLFKALYPHIEFRIFD